MRKMKTSPGAWIVRLCALALLRAYRVAISPAIGPVCRHLPSCSVYAEEAIVEWGLPRGAYLALRRLLRCHPFSAGGWDPVPKAVVETSSSRKAS